MGSNQSLLIIILIILGCAVATYTDIKYGKISNKIVLIYGSIPIICNWVNIIAKGNLTDYIINSSIVAIIAVILYMAHTWAGGDCKMMIFIALSVPTEVYWDITGWTAPLTLIYVFIFLLGFLYICIDNANMILQKKCAINKKAVSIELKKGVCQYLRNVIYLSMIGYIYLIFIYQYMEMPAILYTLVSMIFIIFINKIKLFRNRWIVSLVFILDCSMCVLTESILITTLWYVYAIILFLMTLRVVSNIFNYEDINTSEIKQGMILSQESSLILRYSKVKGLPKISDETLKSRMSEEEAAAVRRWGKSKRGFTMVRIVRKIPFAIFIATGLIIYLCIGWICFDY